MFAATGSVNGDKEQSNDALWLPPEVLVIRLFHFSNIYHSLPYREEAVMSLIRW